MSKEALLINCRDIYSKLTKLNFNELELIKYINENQNSVEYEEFKKTLTFVLATLNGLTINKTWNELSAYTVNQLAQFMQRPLDEFEKFKGVRRSFL